MAIGNLAHTAGTEAGAISLIASYGIRIHNSADAHVAFPTIDSHGTSLPICSNDFMQTGPAFLIGNQLAKQWQKYVEGNILKKEIEDDLIDHHADSGDEVDLFDRLHL